MALTTTSFLTGGAGAFSNAIETFNNIGVLEVSRTELKSITSMIAKMPSPKNLQFDFPKEWSAHATGAFSGDGDKSTGNYGGVNISYFMSSFIAALAVGGDAESGLSNKFSKSLNKNEKVLFQTLGFRSIQLDWEFVPKSAEEAKDIEKMIYDLKRYSAPYSSFGQGTWDFPDTFQLEISSKQGNYIAFKTPQMACTNLTVNHTPQGFMAGHTDGYPVQTNLSMTFMERELATREKIESGAII